MRNEKVEEEGVPPLLVPFNNHHLFLLRHPLHIFPIQRCSWACSASRLWEWCPASLPGYRCHGNAPAAEGASDRERGCFFGEGRVSRACSLTPPHTNTLLCSWFASICLFLHVNMHYTLTLAAFFHTYPHSICQKHWHSFFRLINQIFSITLHIINVYIATCHCILSVSWLPSL